MISTTHTQIRSYIVAEEMSAGGLVAFLGGFENQGGKP
jgi:hypothetical protein